MKHTIATIMDLVCNHYSYRPQLIFAVTRERHIVEKRQIFFYLVRKYTNCTLSDMQRFTLEYRGSEINHATIIHSIKAIGILRVSDASIREQVNEIESEITGYNGVIMGSIDLLKLCNVA